jgi:hypothetical protein
MSPGETFAGFGHYTFDDAPGIYGQGEGLFADIHKGRKEPARWTSVELRRVDGADLDRITRIMKGGSDNAKASEIVKTFETFTRAEGQAT